MSKKPLPPPDTAWFDPTTGRPTEIFFDYMQNIDARILREPVNPSATAVGSDVLTYNGTNNYWEPT